MELRGKVALVTGAAIRVGRANALALAREGANILVHYASSEDEAHATAEDIRVLGVEAETVKADLTNPAEIDALFEAAAIRFGRLDVLVNSAASFLRKPLEEVTVDEWDRVMALNLRAPFLCTQRAAKLMRTVKRYGIETGLIINIADLSGMFAWTEFSAHGISKAGIIHLTTISARALAPDIRVNCVVPGAVMPGPDQPRNDPAFLQIGDRLPIQRVGHQDNVAQTILFYAANDFITGEVLTVDGGEHLLGPYGH